jgi:hypothetical protein
MQSWGILNTLFSAPSQVMSSTSVKPLLQEQTNPPKLFVHFPWAHIRGKSLHSSMSSRIPCIFPNDNQNCFYLLRTSWLSEKEWHILGSPRRTVSILGLNPSPPGQRKSNSFVPGCGQESHCDPHFLPCPQQQVDLLTEWPRGMEHVSSA